MPAPEESREQGERQGSQDRSSTPSQPPSPSGTEAAKQQSPRTPPDTPEYFSPPCYLPEFFEYQFGEGPLDPVLSTPLSPMNISNRTFREATLCLHAGTHLDPTNGGVCTPLYTSTAFAFPNDTNTPIYPRYFNTPNQEVICQKLTALEQGEDALVFSSGMAAISSVLLTFLNPGDHAVFQEDLYGGTRQFIQEELIRLGVEVTFFGSGEDFASAIQPKTRIIYLESPSNPLLHCVDLKSIAQIASEKKILTVVDNTFATPINQNPLTLGIDVVLHSATKYLNGHSDVSAGAVISSREVINRLTKTAVNLGGMLDAHSCYQLERGLKTLALRVHQHNKNATALAQYLQKHPQVAQVNYPGLPDHSCYEIATSQMRGYGGMLSFELRDPSVTEKLLREFRVVTPALSLGGIESLVCIPSLTSHRGMSAAERERCGIREGLVRVSVGIEDIEDLLEDFQCALSAAHQFR